MERALKGEHSNVGACRFGRSIGATCAVHLASKHPREVHGLIIDSGLMSIKQLPRVQMRLVLVITYQ